MWIPNSALLPEPAVMFLKLDTYASTLTLSNIMFLTNKCLYWFEVNWVKPKPGNKVKSLNENERVKSVSQSANVALEEKL